MGGLKRKICTSGLVVAVLFVFPWTSRSGSANDKKNTFDFQLLPGESRVISHSMSASRDTALMGYQVLPRVVLTTGADFAVFGFLFSGLDMRVGMFGIIEVQTTEPEPLNFLTVPSGPYLWRGLLGYSVSLALERLATRWLENRGALEISLSFRHESEHYTGSGEDLEEAYRHIPNIGDFLLLDLATRKAIGPLDIEARIQNKFFLSSADHKPYSLGPGGDLVFRLRLPTWAHPFLSLFGEYLFADSLERDGEVFEVPDNYLVRALLGVVFPGKVADLQIFMATSVGHGKGLLSDQEEFCLGWGIRIGLFKNALAQNV
jgi:hypothetical protein